MVTKQRICYSCGAPATSDEHVPPKCIFPEAKDLGVDLRRNLIKVPSCEEHNLAKSKDDEFLMVSIAGILGNNSIGYGQSLTKVNRALRRSAGRLLESTLRNRKREVVPAGKNRFVDVIWGTPDQERLERCFRSVARGLYFNSFGKPFSGTVNVLMGFIHHNNANAAAFARFIKHRAAIDLEGKEQIGANPDAFFYQVSDLDRHGLRLFRMCFYGGTNVYAALLPKDVELPPDLVMMLIGGGIETHMRLEDRMYVFNRTESEV